MPLKHSLIIHLKKKFMVKKKTINVLTIFFFFLYKSGVKTFLK